MESIQQHAVATNTEDGNASFIKLPQNPLNRQAPFGTITTIYSNPIMLPDVSFGAQRDLDLTAKHSQTGPGDRICPDDGFAASILVIHPGASTPMHRTWTVDMGIVVEGEVDLHLDNGDVRTLKAGDTVVIRGAMHQWVNTSQKDVKMFATILDANPIIGADGKELSEAWL